jgi:hypothetical protein
VWEKNAKRPGWRRPPIYWGSPPEPSATDYRAELLPSTKEDGTVYVLLPDDMSRDAERDPDDTPGGMPPSDSDTLTSGLVERIPPQLEAPSQARESPETASAEPDREQQPPRSATGRAREEASERPW